MTKNKVAVVVPNWDGLETIADCLKSLAEQSLAAEIFVVDNGSIDNSVKFIKQNYPQVHLVELSVNLGFAGGVNVGIKAAIEAGCDFVALFNNDAVADKNWLKELVKELSANDNLGIVTCKFMDGKGKKLDSTGDYYTVWGLPYPRGRGETVLDKYDNDTEIFAATGGASLYRVKMLQQIGLFDESFFAYYEDVDLSFRAQLAGWKVRYVPAARAYHQIGATSSKIKGFTTYQTLKNLPQIGRKNVPWKLVPKVLPRLIMAYWLFVLSALGRGQIISVIKGCFMALIYLPKNFIQRHSIQKNRRVSVDYINSMLVHDLPPNALKLRQLRAQWWKLTGRKNG